MNIPKFPLPSRPETEIQFHAPTVKDALKYSDLNPAEDEATTTEYLNSMQDGEINDSAYWTVGIAELPFGGYLLIRAPMQ